MENESKDYPANQANQQPLNISSSPDPSAPTLNNVYAPKQFKNMSSGVSPQVTVGNEEVVPVVPVASPNIPQTTAKASKMPMFLVAALVLLLLIGAGTYLVFFHKAVKPKLSNSTGQSSQTNKASTSSSNNSGYETAVNAYITDFQNKDMAAADALQTAAFSSYIKSGSSSQSYYSLCQSAGQLCAGYFSKQYLTSAVKSTTSYTSKAGVKGYEITYTVSTPGSKTSTESVSSSSSSLTIEVIPVNRVWLVDNIDTK